MTPEATTSIRPGELDALMTSPRVDTFLRPRAASDTLLYFIPPGYGPIASTMTRLRGASLDSPDVAQPAGGDRPQYNRTKAPPNAPDVILQNTVEVSDPSRVLPWYRDERRRRFNTLVRR